MKYMPACLISIILMFSGFPCPAQITVSDKPSDKTVVFGNSKLRFTLDYDKKCVITNLVANDEQVISGKNGIVSGIRTPVSEFSTSNLTESPGIDIGKNQITVTGINYGNSEATVSEIWKIFISDSSVRFDIERSVNKEFIAEEVFFPVISFDRITTWEGAFTGYGGLAWFYLFNERLCTYGVHSGYSAFWNSTTGNGLVVSASVSGRETVSKFTRDEDDRLIYSVSVSDKKMNYRYDEGTLRRRFVRGKTDVWDSFSVPAGKYTESVSFSWMNYSEEYNRGRFKGINGNQVTSLLNTIARIGVIDENLFGGNSWHTPYGPICLHEQYIGQMGLAINDDKYLEGYKNCLEFYRDNAISDDGRVLSRWAYTDGDAMSGTVNKNGFYEAQWGYLLDSNSDFVTNVAEIYDQCGDLEWVKQFKPACEKALEYLLNRDENGNHLVEVMTDSHIEKKGSDWIDIIWASYENAFINAKLYYALTLWTDIEKQLGDNQKASLYSDFAFRLKESFNKTIEEGGFWNNKDKWYIYWIDKDKSVHGNNLVIPVNFMAIAYGICDDDLKRKAILDRVEQQMQKENLFAWPLNLYTYEEGEGNDWQFPFPQYENGDIFLSWGAIGVEAYAAYKPELALKYIENILERYDKDGLAFQRYGRLKQDGLGDDILAGNSLAVVGLYKSVYGINPLYNRLYLNPHLPEKLSGTVLNYNFRGKKLKIGLDLDVFSISDDRFTLISKKDFGFNVVENDLLYFNSDEKTCSLKAHASDAMNLAVEIIKWNENVIHWKHNMSGKKDKISYSIYNLDKTRNYEISVDDKTITKKTDMNGSLMLENVIDANSEIRIKIK